MTTYFKTKLLKLNLYIPYFKICVKEAMFAVIQTIYFLSNSQS